MPQDESMQALNQMLDILDSQIKKASRGQNLGSLAAAALMANARMRGIGAKGGRSPDDFFSELEKGTIEDTRAAPEEQAQSLSAQDLDQQVRECKHIVDRYAREAGAAQSQAHQALKGHFDQVYKNPEKALENFDKLVNSDDIEQAAENLMHEGGGLSQEDGQKIAAIKERLAEQGVDIQNGGQRIFARELMKEVPNAFDTVKGKKGLFADKDYKASMKALNEFEPQAEVHLDNDAQIAMAEHNHEVAALRMDGIEADMAQLRDRQDLEQVAGLDKGLQDAVDGPHPGQSQEKDDSYEIER